MAIRRAITQDSHRLSDVILEASQSIKSSDFTEGGWTLFERASTPNMFQRKIESDDYFALVYELNSEIVAYLAMMKYEKIDHMFVLPEYRNKGICKKLWIAARQLCSENGNNDYFWVRSSSYAKKVYESFGFRSKGAGESFNGISFQFMELKQ